MGKEQITVMMSGGLDSFIAYRMAQKMGYNPIALFVDYGQPYLSKELKSLSLNGIEPQITTINGYITTPPTIDNWIIPGRNMLLALIGATRSGKVWISALDGEMHKLAREKDKTPEFFHLASAICTYTFDIVRPETIIETPFKNMTKTEVVRWALDNGITEQQLKNTSSCYHEEFKNCGLCGTCFKRWVAMKNNGIEEEYKYDPMAAGYATRTVGDMIKAHRDKDYSHYSEKRCNETLSACGMSVRDKI